MSHTPQISYTIQHPNDDYCIIVINDFEYYGALTDNLYELEGCLFDTIFDAEISKFIDNVQPEHIQSIDIPLYNLPLFRARYNEGDGWQDDSKQFTYNHDQQKCKLYRLNKAGEQVLYTSTNPYVACNEIARTESNNSIFLTMFMAQNKTETIKLALCMPGVGKVSGNAKKYANYLSQKDDAAINYHERLGNIIEADIPPNISPDVIYQKTAALASKILNTHDAIMTVSKKSNMSELNITLKKDIVDKLLKIKRIFEINITDESVHILRIGKDKNGKIKWHKCGFMNFYWSCWLQLRFHSRKYLKA